MRKIKIGLIDVDGHNFPNLPLMKLSAWHKAQGDFVEWYDPLFGGWYDKVYLAKVFDFTSDYQYPVNADEIVRGGTGYYYPDGGADLPPEIEHIYPDYGLYNITDTAYGFLTRGCPRGCDFCIVGSKEGRASRKVADLSEFWRGQKEIKLLDPNLIAYKGHLKLLQQLIDSKAWVDFTQGIDCRLLTEQNIEALNAIKVKEIHFAWDCMRETNAIMRGLKLYAKHAKRKPHGYYATVYMLTNYDTTLDEDLYRIYTLRDMAYSPFVMIYDKKNAPKEIRHLQRWVNNKIIFRSKNAQKFEDYLKVVRE